ncbi:MAG: hypothetical protein JWQ38_1531, partial [Flavipsychrobacter sp.]|nr:hypothetical protein [Flavipsychrobacter sp.]
MQRSILKLFIFFAACLLSFHAQAQLTADFKASDTAFCAPGIVFFTNTSIGATSYSWDLGNGVLYSGTDASTSYTSVGTYTVTLVASNGSATSTKKLIVVAYGPPTISFFANPTNACLKSPITFTSTSTANMWGGLEYTWNFGDGASSTLANPTYAYTSPAYYNITLLAKNKGKCTSSLTKGTYIHALNPVAADFESPDNHQCLPPVTVHFNNLSTGTPTLTYQWFFGDGGTSTLPNPSHI